MPECEKMVADPDVALFDLADITPEEICLPYETGSFAWANDGIGFAFVWDHYDPDAALFDLSWSQETESADEDPRGQ